MVTFTDIPDQSKLMLIGDWFYKPSEGWKVVCYFQRLDKSYFRKHLPIELLPALITGKTYPLTSTINQKSGYPGVLVLPASEHWQLLTYADMPKTLRRAELVKEYKEQIEHQPIYRLEDGDYVNWLPVNELARMLFFQSAEIVRTAALEGNTYQLAKAEKTDWIGKITFESHVPLNFINSLEYRRFFAWLMFDESAQYGFGSIFNNINSNSVFRNNVRCWTFNFAPPNVEGCSVTWSGYTGIKDKGEGHHRYIREIRSIAGVPAPELDMVEFKHPEDFIDLEKDDDEDDKKKLKKTHPIVDPRKINTGEAPKSKGKRYTINVSKAGFHFETDLDLCRSPRTVRMLPKGVQDDLDDLQEEDTVGVTQGKTTGKIPRADVDTLDSPDPIKPSEKLQRFEVMLDTLANECGWTLTFEKGDVPKKNCRTAHLVNGEPRQFCHVRIKIGEELFVYALEIELKDKETLSTLLYRPKSNLPLYNQILDGLMASDYERDQKAMQWNRKEIKEMAISSHFLGHPDKKLLSEEEVNESWSVRAKQKLLTL